jgi:hypothetical protein
LRRARCPRYFFQHPAIVLTHFFHRKGHAGKIPSNSSLLKNLDCDLCADLVLVKVKSYHPPLLTCNEITPPIAPFVADLVIQNVLAKVSDCNNASNKLSTNGENPGPRRLGMC